MKKTSLVLALLLMMSFVLCACGTSNELVGEWKGEWRGEIMILEDDGTGTMNMNGLEIDFVYETADGKITVTIDDDVYGNGESVTSEYTIEGDKLIIDGSEYIRQ